MKIIKPPTKLTYEEMSYGTSHSIFLAGSIEMGNAENWQDRITKFYEDKEFIILNPRRDDWDSSWVQSISNLQFKEQVEWELEAQDIANRIIMYFDPNTKSPISLLELGLYAGSGKMTVICPDGFWRKGNVEIVCAKYKIPLFNSIDTFMLSEKLTIKIYGQRRIY